MDYYCMKFFIFYESPLLKASGLREINLQLTIQKCMGSSDILAGHTIVVRGMSKKY